FEGLLGALPGEDFRGHRGRSAGRGAEVPRSRAGAHRGGGRCVEDTRHTGEARKRGIAHLLADPRRLNPDKSGARRAYALGMSRTCTFYLLLSSGAIAFAQESRFDSPAGITFFERLSGSASRLGSVTRLDSTIGYNFNRYLGIDAGVPVYFVRPSSSTQAA